MKYVYDSDKDYGYLLGKKIMYLGCESDTYRGDEEEPVENRCAICETEDCRIKDFQNNLTVVHNGFDELVIKVGDKLDYAGFEDGDCFRVHEGVPEAKIKRMCSI
jgi:hypothetical protein